MNTSYAQCTLICTNIIEMTTSSKKRRGKQRKAANVQKELNSKHNDSVSIYKKSLGSIGPSKVIEDIQKRDEVAVETLCEWTGMFLARTQQFGLENSVGDTLFYKDLIDGGLVSALVDLVNEGCSEELVGDFHDDSITGTTMIFLANIANDASDSFQLQIASAIGPVISCMVNDIDREYFKSNKHWHTSLQGFIYLISNLLHTEVAEVVLVLLEYQGLLDFIIQSMFFGVYRLDIVNESVLSSEAFFNMIASATRAVDCVLASEQYNEQTDEGRKLLYRIATMPVVSKAYDPDCKTLVIFGLINLLKHYINQPSGEKKKFYSILLRLTMGDCVDKEVITSVIDLGFNYTNQYEEASGVCAVLSGILIPRDGSLNTGDPDVLLTQPNDKRYAIAIDAGLFEMCLGLVVKYGGLNVDGSGRPINDDHGFFTGSIRNIFDAANHVSFRKKSSKSITNRQQKLIDALDLYEDRIPKNDICNEIFVRLQSIVSINHSAQQSVSAERVKATCLRCSKVLFSKDIRRCIKCNSPYCSRECQVDDWRNGKHKEECKTLSNESSQSGRGKEISSKSQKQELAIQKNLHKVGMDLFHKNTMRFVMQAACLGYDIVEVICVINFCVAPPLMKVMTYEELLSKHFRGDGDSDFILNSREAHKDELPLAFISCKPNGSGDAIVLMSYYGPKDNAEDNSWSKRQVGTMEMVEKYSNMEDFWDMVYDNPGLQESLLKSIDEAGDGNVGVVTNLIAYAKEL